MNWIIQPLYTLIPNQTHFDRHRIFNTIQSLSTLSSTLYANRTLECSVVVHTILIGKAIPWLKPFRTLCITVPLQNQGTLSSLKVKWRNWHWSRHTMTCFLKFYIFGTLQKLQHYFHLISRQNAHLRSERSNSRCTEGLLARACRVGLLTIFRRILLFCFQILSTSGLYVKRERL